MARPTEEQIRKYEFDHKAQFANLVIANNLWLAMPGKYGFNPNNTGTKQYKAWFNLGQAIAKLAGKWGHRQIKLEGIKDANVLKVSPYLGYFLKPQYQKQLTDLALKMVKPDPKGTGLGTVPILTDIDGMGFIPLLIWGAIVLIAALSASYIIDETTTTAEEKGELLKVTEQTLKDLNIPPDKAAELIKQTQQEATQTGGGLMSNLTGGSSFLPIAIVAVAAFALSKN